MVEVVILLMMIVMIAKKVIASILNSAILNSDRKVKKMK